MKKDQIIFGINQIQKILENINKEKRWNIQYFVSTDPIAEFNAREIRSYGIQAGEEYFLIYKGTNLLYVINVTGDSALTALSELMRLIARKF